MLKKTLVAAATTMALAGLTATAASAAYDLTGGNYATQEASPQSATFTLSGGAPVVCTSSSFSGNTDNVSGDPASTAVTPVLSGCSQGYALPLVARVSHPWKLTVTGPQGGTGSFDAVVSAPDRTLVEFVDPVAVAFPAFAPFACKYTVKTPVGGALVRVRRGANGLIWDVSNSNLEYSGVNCAASGTGTSGLLGGERLLPGVDIATL